MQFDEEKKKQFEGKERSGDKVLESFLGQGHESWSWYLSFESLEEEFIVGFPLQEGEVFP